MNFSHVRTVPQSLREYGRGVSGGLIFALPLLFTMELWEVGSMTSPLKLLSYIVVTFCLLILYNRYAGLRSDASFYEVMIDSVEELAIGILLALGILLLLDRIGSENSLYEILSAAVMEGMTLAIGVSVGTAQLGTEEASNAGGMEGDTPHTAAVSDYLGESAIALCGAILFAANIAPTDEVGHLVRDVEPGKLFGLMVFSLVMGAIILNFSEFRGAKGRSINQWRELSREIITAYAAALVASALMIYFFRSIPFATPMQFVSGMVIVGLPAMLGASAGRLLLQIDK